MAVSDPSGYSQACCSDTGGELAVVGCRYEAKLADLQQQLMEVQEALAELQTEYDETKARFVKQEAVAIGSSKSICYVNQQHIATATSSELL